MKFLDFPVRIRYAETDQMKVSYHANYFIWFEAARAELFRELKLPYTQFEEKNMFLPVADAYCKYYSPTYYDQLIYVRASVSLLKFSSMKFTYQILNEAKSEVLAWGYTTHVFVGEDKRPIKIPEEVKKNVELFTLSEKK